MPVLEYAAICQQSQEIEANVKHSLVDELQAEQTVPLRSQVVARGVQTDRGEEPAGQRRGDGGGQRVAPKTEEAPYVQSPEESDVSARQSGVTHTIVALIDKVKRGRCRRQERGATLEGLSLGIRGLVSGTTTGRMTPAGSFDVGEESSSLEEFGFTMKQRTGPHYRQHGLRWCRPGCVNLLSGP